MTTEKATNSNKIESTQQQGGSELNPAKSPSLQFGISVAIGVLTILLLSATYFFGIFGGSY